MSKRSKKSLVVGVSVSMASGVAAVSRLQDRWHLIPFTVAVIISAWYGGLYSGLAATVSGFLVADYLFIGTSFAFGGDTPLDWAFMGLFVAIGVATSLLFEELRRKNEALEGMVQKLDQSNRDLEQFSYTVAHDLSTPLRSIRTMTELFVIQNKDNLDQNSARLLDLVVTNAHRMHTLIQEILELAKTRQGEVEIVEVDTRVVVDAALDFLHEQIEQSGASVVVRELPVVRGNQVLLLRVFSNLIGNAIKYGGEEPPAIEVSARSRDKEHVFAIRDNGIGVDPKYQEKIFQPFQRVHGEIEGSGIGLAVCKQIVDRLHGRIWVESELGKGSTFYFSLPA